MSTFDPYQPRSNFGWMIVLAFAGAAILGGAIYFFLSAGPKKEPVVAIPEESAEEEEAHPDDWEQARSQSEPDPVLSSQRGKTNNPFEVAPAKVSEPSETVARPSPEQILIDAGMGVAELEPEVLLRKIGTALQDADLEQASLLIGRKALDESLLRGLQKLAETGAFRRNPTSAIVELGELEANRRSRWALDYGAAQDSRIYFDLSRGQTGNWKVERVKLPGEGAEPVVFDDAFGIAHAFLKAALRQEFDDARSFVDSREVSDAKIAGLCIIFEEAKYQLRDKKPLRAMFERELTAGFLAHVEDASGEKAADFGLSLQRPSVEQPWRVIEVNLDSLLADYAERVAGGDVHYTPLVKNPTGGDTLILYFGFDEDGLTPRTKRQLEIVAGLLKLDPSKKLTLSGHTDSLGTDQYNQRLSARRAGTVESYLRGAGVSESQIVSMAEGEAKPRLPNSTEDGEDNPVGRRANRRTEIYLDF